MSPSFWKRLSLVQAVCILALVVGAIWWNQRTRSCTQTETLRALYEFLKPVPSDDRVFTPLVVDLTTEHGNIRWHVNGQQMDAYDLAGFAAHVAESSPLDPIIVRSSSGLAVERVVQTMGMMADHGLKIFIVPLDYGTLALTDRNITHEGQLPDLESIPNPPQK